MARRKPKPVPTIDLEADIAALRAAVATIKAVIDRQLAVANAALEAIERDEP